MGNETSRSSQLDTTQTTKSESLSEAPVADLDVVSSTLPSTASQKIPPMTTSGPMKTSLSARSLDNGTRTMRDRWRSLKRKFRRKRNSTPPVAAVRLSPRQSNAEAYLAKTNQILPDISNLRVIKGSVERDWMILKKRCLGTGFNGAVVMAEHRKTGMKAAVKSFAKNKMSKKQKVDMLRDEINVYLSLDHPNICKLFYAYEDRNHVWLVMELCREELYDRLCAVGKYSEKQTAEACAEMFSGLVYLHNHKIVHRDLKLENWMYSAPSPDYARNSQTQDRKKDAGQDEQKKEKKGVEPLDPNSKLKLIDFGFSRFCEKSDVLELPCGTLHYASPDVLRRSYNKECDLWSSGVITFMLLTGSPPFVGSTNQAVIEKIRAGKVRFNSRWNTLSENCKNFVLRLLEPDSSKRMTGAQALEHDFIRASFYRQSLRNIDTHGLLWNLRTFAAGPRLIRAVLLMLAYSLSTAETTELMELFFTLDKQGTGTLSRKNFVALLKRMDKNMSDGEIHSIFDTMAMARNSHFLTATHSMAGDIDDDGEEIFYSQFLAGMLHPTCMLHEKKLRFIFDTFDYHSEGFIGKEELATVLNRRMSDADNMIKEVGNGLNSGVDFEELLQAVKRMPRLVPMTQNRHDYRDSELNRDSALLYETCDPLTADARLTDVNGRMTIDLRGRGTVQGRITMQGRSTAMSTAPDVLANAVASKTAESMTSTAVPSPTDTEKSGNSNSASANVSLSGVGVFVGSQSMSEEPRRTDGGFDGRISAMPPPRPSARRTTSLNPRSSIPDEPEINLDVQRASHLLESIAAKKAANSPRGRETNYNQSPQGLNSSEATTKIGQSLTTSATMSTLPPSVGTPSVTGTTPNGSPNATNNSTIGLQSDDYVNRAGQSEVKELILADFQKKTSSASTNSSLDANRIASAARLSEPDAITKEEEMFRLARLRARSSDRSKKGEMVTVAKRKSLQMGQAPMVEV